jgi:hypothetical protein
MYARIHSFSTNRGMETGGEEGDLMTIIGKFEGKVGHFGLWNILSPTVYKYLSCISSGIHGTLRENRRSVGQIESCI